MLSSAPPRRHILFFLHLIQDVDLIAPVIKEALSHEECAVSVWVTDRLYHQFPRASRVLRGYGLNIRVLSYAASFFGFFPALSGIDVLITASESNARPHRVAHLLTKMANLRRIQTYTLQQGFENCGLTYFDAEHTPGEVEFASGTIFLWGGLQTLHTQARVGSRCVPAGYTKQVTTAATADALAKKNEWGKPVVSIFENLHRKAYTPLAVSDFMDCLTSAVRQCPEIHFILRPHPNQRWTAIHKKNELSALGHLDLADPKDTKWAFWTTADLVSVSDAVITAPSTVALDAALATCPVAVVAMGNDVQRYSPLTTLKKVDEWCDFIRLSVAPPGRTDEKMRAQQFAKKYVLAGDAARRIINFVIRARSSIG